MHNICGIYLVFAVCDDTCKEVVLDPENELLVCTISGHCFDRLLSPCEIAGDMVCSVLKLYNAPTFL